MREIKFRQWSSGRFHYWGCNSDNFTSPLSNRLDIPSEQFTGLRDKNGKEIYEGDVVCFAGYMTADDSFDIDPNGFMYDEDDMFPIVWNEKMALWEPKFDDDEHWKYKRDTRGLMVKGSCEIIGNIHENPELLEASC